MRKTVRQALEDALVEAPDDLATHAAYADLLTEEGDPRGEFVAVQLALEDTARPPRERKRLRAREQGLLRVHQRAWLGPLAEFLFEAPPPEEWDSPVPPAGDFVFRRGWLHGLRLRLLPLRMARAMREAPECRLLQELTIESGYDYESRDATEPADGVPEGEVQRGLWPLAQSPYLGNVRKFQLGVDDGDDYGNYRCYTHTAAVVPLVRRMPRIEELRLFANEFDATALFALPTLAHLRILQLHHYIGVHRLHVLAANPALAGLTHLLLHPHHWGASWRVGDVEQRDGYRPEDGFLPLREVQALLASPHLTKLTHLRLRCSNLGNAGCEAIVASGILKRLESLDLRHGRIRVGGARALAACPDLKRLRWLDLGRNSINAAGARALEEVGIPMRLDEQHPPARRLDEAGEERSHERRWEENYLCQGEFE